MKLRRRVRTGRILFLTILFTAVAFGVIILHGDGTNPMPLWILAGTLGLLLFQYGMVSIVFPAADKYTLLIVWFLEAVGIAFQCRLSVDTALRTLIFMAVATALLLLSMAAIRRWKFWARLWPLLIVGSFVLLAISLWSDAVYGAQSWLSIGGITFQPSELVKVALVLGLAGILCRERGWRNLLLFALYTGGCLILLLMQRDLGAALLYFGTAVVMLYAHTGSRLLTGAALGTGACGSVLAYYLFSHVRVRVALWKDPWSLYEGQGYQVVQGLIAIASGGFFGMGLTMGSPYVVPVQSSDYIFAVICEEFGWIFALCLVALYLVLIVRGINIATAARNSFDALVAMGCVTMITLQSFINIGGVIKLIPLTGITLPFLSYGGSSLLACTLLVGILEGIAIKNAAADWVEYEYDPAVVDTDYTEDGEVWE